MTELSPPTARNTGTPSAFSRRFNRGEEGVSAKWQSSMKVEHTSAQAGVQTFGTPPVQATPAFTPQSEAIKATRLADSPYMKHELQPHTVGLAAGLVDGLRAGGEGGHGALLAGARSRGGAGRALSRALPAARPRPEVMRAIACAGRSGT